MLNFLVELQIYDRPAACDPPTASAPNQIKIVSQLCAILLAFASQTIFTKSLQAQSKEHPNIVVILTDDQGWGDLSLHGNKNLSTPNLDLLANEGVAFENFYVCAVCAPTRAEFLTGRYHHRTGVSGVSRGEGRINPSESLIGERFKTAGYATGCFGKWHNGTQSPLHPNDRGFDEFYGFTSGHWGHYFSPPLDHNGQVVRGDGFVVDDFTNHAIGFIRKHASTPFFCYLPLNTPHSPMMVDDRFYDQFANLDPVSKHREADREDVAMTRAAMAMCENIDWNVGRVLTTLNELEIANDTIVVFFCDNGPNSFRYNGGMKGKKGTLDEGGLRSPLFIRWPGKIAAATKVDTVAGAIDLLPTLSALANVEAKTQKPIDGRNLAPLWSDPDQAWKKRNLFSLWRNKVTVRDQRFRLDAQSKLFDIQNDRGQRFDVSDQFPKRAAALKQAADRFSAAARRNNERFADRPFHVGYRPSTTLPARDAVEHGTIQRSAKPPNNSFFRNWTSEDDSITWEIGVKAAGQYNATIHYTCAAGDEGVKITASVDGGDAATAPVTQVFDPPLYDKSKERVKDSHYFVKDFRPLRLGSLRLEQGRQTLRLTAADFQGKQAIDVHSIVLTSISAAE
ncbi:arylsulfatase [Planctomycetes bacterium K23_9]|uniref:Arylsulfatase n=1 Tax=Stieleria marina TaxID=1930275 RepID=A0A517NT64_9BACT|nr:Arylsulfatase [Planctomycetes bacterium K23_9]